MIVIMQGIMKKNNNNYESTVFPKGRDDKL